LTVESLTDTPQTHSDYSTNCLVAISWESQQTLLAKMCVWELQNESAEQQENSVKADQLAAGNLGSHDKAVTKVYVGSLIFFVVHTQTVF
jgi:hypothetical protein